MGDFRRTYSAENAYDDVYWSFHPTQWQVFDEIIRNKLKYVFLACGARWGKDCLCSRAMIRIALELALDRQRRGARLYPRVNCWVVAPKREMYGGIQYDLMNAVFPKKYWKRLSDREEYILPGGIRISFKSTYKPEELVAEGVDIIQYTEASRDPRGHEAYFTSLLPRLASQGRYGLIMLTGTPRPVLSGAGRGTISWYKELWHDAKSGKIPYAGAWNFPTSSNPAMVDRIDALRATMPYDAFKMEIEAQWINSDGLVFSLGQLNNCVADKPQVQFGGQAIIAIDPAFREDDCAVVVSRVDVDGIHHVIDAYRWNMISLPNLIDNMINIYKKHAPALVVVDSTGIGDVVASELERVMPRGRVKRQIWDRKSKGQLVYNARKLLDHGRIIFNTAYMSSDELAELIYQLNSYESLVDDNGEVVYGGDKDDYVAAFMMSVMHSELEYVMSKKRSSQKRYTNISRLF